MNVFHQSTVKLLSSNLEPQHVKKRSQAGRDLSYIEAWHAIAEANRIFGFDAWTRETVEMRMVSERETTIGKTSKYPKPGFAVSYLAKVRVTVNGIVREGQGAGHGIDQDLGQAHESAAKEAESDAMKRAFMTFGNPFGLALYDKTQANVGPNNNDDAEPEAPEPQAAKTPTPVARFRAKVDQLAEEGPAAIKAFVDGKATQDYIAKWDKSDRDDALAYAQEAIDILLGKAKEAAE